MRVLLLQLDGKLPNLALMRLAAHHRAQGHAVELRECRGTVPFDPWDRFEAVYASAIFKDSAALVAQLRAICPTAVVGGSGVGSRTLADVGVSEDIAPDYSVYPRYAASVGFTMRGCPRRCPFCVVPEKEGRERSVGTVANVWRGEGHPRRLLLLDNNFFAQPAWRERVAEICDGEFQVSLCQGIDLRAITEEQAGAAARMNLRSINFGARRIYSAWDRRADERLVMRGLDRLAKAGVEMRYVMLYVLVGFDPAETVEDRIYRATKLRDLGCMPYIMPFERRRDLLGFQRWVNYGYYRVMSWAQWEAEGYQAHAEERRRSEERQMGLFA